MFEYLSSIFTGSDDGIPLAVGDDNEYGREEEGQGEENRGYIRSAFASPGRNILTVHLPVCRVDPLQ
jgi:hypothetical protein